ncbi:mitochondrial carrier domain-containing protein [Chytriomyces sp. MP71]|nr:mitochondrial carrier domain-containing protein [Chytriomyces sp. MP71]
MRERHGQSKSTKGILGAGTAGLMELFLFHPVDTIGKRLINDRTRRFSSWSAFSKENRPNLRTVIFKDAAGTGIVREIGSLYPAFGFAIVYKVMQRSLQFGIHPIINRYLLGNYAQEFQDRFGPRLARTMVAGTGGVLIGLSEVLLLPLDALKVKGQTGVKVLSGKASLHRSHAINPEPESHSRAATTKNLIQNPRLLLGLYRGASWTAIRNCFGCFALFGTSTFIKDQTFDLYNPRNATQTASLAQHFVASLTGACASIVVAAPFDVIKVRMQATSLNATGVSGVRILRELVDREGVRALMKGVGPKLMASAPKVTFSFTVAQWMSDFFDSLF